MKDLRIQDLSVGDWVSIDGEPRKINSINGISGIVSFDGLGNYCGTGVIEPIPITAEVLEKNGFTTTDKRYYICKLCNTRVDVERLAEHYEIATFGILSQGGLITKMICPITNIHQLQHALRLVGIDKDITL